MLFQHFSLKGQTNLRPYFPLRKMSTFALALYFIEEQVPSIQDRVKTRGRTCIDTFMKETYKF